MAGAATIGEANEILQEFLPRFNPRFAVAAEQPETAYRPVPDELSLTETICLRDTRKVARDNTVKYQWRVLQLLPGVERPSYAGLRVGHAGTGRRKASDSLPRRGGGLSGGTAALLGAVGRSQRLYRCCGAARRPPTGWSTAI